MRLALLVALMLVSASPLRAETLLIPLPDGTALRAAFVPAAPEVPPRPAVVALHGCAGIGTGTRPLAVPARERDWAARLAALGHPVVFPDSFGSRGLGPACGRPEHPAGASAVRSADARATAAFMSAQPGAVPGGVVLLGWSHGGSTVLAAAAEAGGVRAAIAFYPGCGRLTFPAGVPRPAVPLLMLLGGADDWTSPIPCRAAAATHADRVEMVEFPGARHGFDRADPTLRSLSLPDGRTVSVAGDPAARAAAIDLVASFLARHAGPAR
jgi:dienelactone hydrolase